MCLVTRRSGWLPAMDTSTNSTVKDPDDWVTGDEPMTGAQASYLETLARQAGDDAPHDLSKAEASKLIDELQETTGRRPEQS